jgi:uncharacterized integral membrane protein
MTASPQPGSDGGAGGAEKWRPSPRQIIAAVIAVVVVIFIVQNRNRVTIDLFTASFSCPLWLLLLVMTAVGMLLCYGFMRRRSKAGAKADGGK